MEKFQETKARIGTSAFGDLEILANSPNRQSLEFAKIPNHDFALVPDHGRVRLLDVVPGQPSVFLESFGANVREHLHFGRGPSQNPQNLTLAALDEICERMVLFCVAASHPSRFPAAS